MTKCHHCHVETDKPVRLAGVTVYTHNNTRKEQLPSRDVCPLCAREIKGGKRIDRPALADSR